MTYKECLIKYASLYKRAYGGDMTGEGTSYYDWAPFYSIDPQWDDQDVLKDPRRYKDTVNSMRQTIRNIRDPKGIGTLNDKPITRLIFSKNKYNQDNNIDAQLWADKAETAIKAKDLNTLKDLAGYGYAWYGTDDATDIPDVQEQFTYQDPLVKSVENKMDKALTWASAGLGTLGLAALAMAVWSKYKQNNR